MSVSSHEPVQERRSEGDEEAGEGEEAGHDQGDEDEPGELFGIGRVVFHRRVIRRGGSGCL